ncbi:MAG TPA: GNAT family N-acetyltransferase [Puia sp.]|nr:GNAT family N-acetyltransferase [Puia sp.]
MGNAKNSSASLSAVPDGNLAYSIRHLHRHEIDDAKWNACIDKAPNGLIYGRSWWLDTMTDGQWDALVLDDYTAIMPLTWKKKWGIRYLYQPPFTQQLGIFSSDAIPASLVEAFLKRVGDHFRFAEIFLNHGNPHSLLQAHANFILALDAPYELLAGNYKKGLVGTLRTAARLPLNYITDLDLSFSLRLNRSKYGERVPHVKKEAYERFEKLCLLLQGRGQAMIRAITGGEGQPLATALLLEERGRLSLLQATTLPEGRRAGANHLLLDKIIQEFSGQTPVAGQSGISGRPHSSGKSNIPGQRLILDFEGSDIPGIAHFYRSFGSTDQPYFFYRHNQLPWPIRLLK